jgi:hypothetical protein
MDYPGNGFTTDDLDDDKTYSDYRVLLGGSLPDVGRPLAILTYAIVRSHQNPMSYVEVAEHYNFNGENGLYDGSRIRYTLSDPKPDALLMPEIMGSLAYNRAISSLKNNLYNHWEQEPEKLQIANNLDLRPERDGSTVESLYLDNYFAQKDLDVLTKTRSGVLKEKVQSLPTYSRNRLHFDSLT